MQKKGTKFDWRDFFSISHNDNMLIILYMTIYIMKPVLPLLAMVDISARLHPSTLGLDAKISPNMVPKNTAEDNIQRTQGRYQCLSLHIHTRAESIATIETIIAKRAIQKVD
jgi:hypothetical protein